MLRPRDGVDKREWFGLTTLVLRTPSRSLLSLKFGSVEVNACASWAAAFFVFSSTSVTLWVLYAHTYIP